MVVITVASHLDYQKATIGNSSNMTDKPPRTIQRWPHAWVALVIQASASGRVGQARRAHHEHECDERVQHSQ